MRDFKISLTGTASFLKNKFVLLFLVVILVVIVFLVLWLLSVQPEGIPVPQEFAGIRPGVINTSELISKLGQPLKEKVIGDQKLLEYQGENQFRPNQVMVDQNQNKVLAIKKPVVSSTKGALENLYIKQYGRPELVLFGPYATVGFRVYVFTTTGLAIVANPNDGWVLEEWYFQPMSASDFTKTIGKGLTNKLPVLP